jgi:hypothetical protein
MATRPLSKRMSRFLVLSATHPLLKQIAIKVQTDCWEWQGKLDPDGYGRFNGYSAARLVWSFYRQEPERGKPFVIRHKCDNLKCCNPLHLTAGTVIDNVRDRVERGRSAVGSRNGRAKLTPSQALEILVSDEPIEQLAKIHGVAPRTVRDLKAGRTWKAIE